MKKGLIALAAALAICSAGPAFTYEPYDPAAEDAKAAAILKKTGDAVDRMTKAAKEIQACHKGLPDVRIGMTKKQVLELVCEVSAVNETVTASGVNEQWVFYRFRWGEAIGCCGADYLYFENGVLRTIQRAKQ
jgi:hypothetical protein